MNPAEIIAAIEAFHQLEPEVQKGIAALIHLFHKKKSGDKQAAPPAPAVTRIPHP